MTVRGRDIALCVVKPFPFYGDEIKIRRRRVEGMTSLVLKNQVATPVATLAIAARSSNDGP
jgi:hypothetical protein